MVNNSRLTSEVLDPLVVSALKLQEAILED